MALLPLKLPPGVYRNGTEYEQSGRWRDANLIRWREGSMRPIGGWVDRKTNAFTYAPRGLHAWVDNSSISHIAAGTYEKLYHVSSEGTVSDITPAGMTTGRLDADQNTAYSGSFYGTSFYGTIRPATGVFREATTWSLDSWGEYLVACHPQDGKLYEWQLNTGTPAAVITNAPTDNAGLIVTEERFIFALAADGNPRKVQWCDRENNTDWTPSATNEAGDLELQTNGRIMTGIRMRGRTLILTTTDAHVATYSGPPYVYGFERVGTACGTISRRGLVAIDEGAFWMGNRGFFHFNGSAATEIPCEVSDYVFRDINTDQISKVYAVNNSQHGEIWWFYPSAGSLENDSYVIFDYKEKHWSVGRLDRTAAIDRGVFSTPIWCDSDGNMYNHETGWTHGTLTPYAESGPISLGSGDTVMKVNSLIPDELDQGNVNVTFKTRLYPNDTERDYGPYDTGNPTSVRFTGRQVRMRIEGATNTNWRAGTMRIEAIPGGRR